MTTENQQATPAPADTLPSGAPNGVTQDDGSSSDDWMTDDVRAAMDFDPFTPAGDEVDPNAATTTNPDGTTPSVDGDGKPVQPTSAQPAPNQQGGAQPEVPAEDLKEFLKQNAQLLNAVVSGQKPVATNEPEPTPDPWANVPTYDYTVPDQLLIGLNSEDAGERSKAIGAVMKGVSLATHQQVLAQIRPIMQNLVDSLPAAIAAFHEHNTIKQTTQNDFYTTYPQLNQPALKPLIGKVAETVMRKNNASTWTPALRDEIAKGVIEIISAATGQAPQAAPVNTPPPAMFGGNNSQGRPAPTVRKTQADHINDLFT